MRPGVPRGLARVRVMWGSQPWDGLGRSVLGWDSGGQGSSRGVAGRLWEVIFPGPCAPAELGPEQMPPCLSHLQKTPPLKCKIAQGISW